MKKIIIIIILIGMIVTGFYLYTKNKTVTNQDGTTTTTGVSFRDFFPFSKPKTDTTNDNEVTPVPDFNIDNNNGEVTTPKLKKIFDGPVAGITLFTKEEPIDPTTIDPTQTAEPTVAGITKAPIKEVKPLTKSVEYLRLVERENGHINDIELTGYKSSKTTDMTVPKVVEALFGTNGNTVVMRYVSSDDNKTIRTYLAKLNPDTTSDATSISYIPYKLTGSFLPDDIPTVSISPSTNKLFYLFPFNNVMLGNILDLTNNKKVENLNTPFHSWLSQFSGEDNIILTTKASARATSYAYLIDKTSNWNKIIGNIYGMTTNTSSDGQNVALSSYGNNGLILNILNTKTGATVRAPANTLSEKCAWAQDNTTLYCGVPDNIPDGEYPDYWYQGLIGFSDTMWEINQEGNGVSLEQLPNIDAINIIPNKDQSKLFFINNKDKSVWELDI